MMKVTLVKVGGYDLCVYCVM